MLADRGPASVGGGKQMPAGFLRKDARRALYVRRPDKAAPSWVDPGDVMVGSVNLDAGLLGGSRVQVPLAYELPPKAKADGGDDDDDDDGDDGDDGCRRGYLPRAAHPGLWPRHPRRAGPVVASRAQGAANRGAVHAGRGARGTEPGPQTSGRGSARGARGDGSVRSGFGAATGERRARQQVAQRAGGATLRRAPEGRSRVADEPDAFPGRYGGRRGARRRLGRRRRLVRHAEAAGAAASAEDARGFGGQGAARGVAGGGGGGADVSGWVSGRRG